MKYVLPTALVIAAAAFGQDEVTVDAWEGSLSAGGLFTSGNTEVSQVDAGLELTRLLAGPDFTVKLKSSATYGRQEQETYQESYLSTLTLKYRFTESNYATASSYWMRDDFAGISHEYGATAGLGRRLLHTGDFSASLEAGAGFLSRENTQGDELETSTGYAGLDLELLLGETWSLTEGFTLTLDLQESDNYSMESVFEAASSLTGSLSLVLGYDLVYHNIPPVEGNEKTDTAMRVQLRLAI